VAAAEAVVTLPFLKMMLWLRGFRRTAAWLDRRTDAATLKPFVGDQIPDAVREVASAVTLIARVHPLRSRCLARSLAVVFMAGRRGHRVELVIGVASPVRGSVEAHAWAEYAGVPVNDHQDVRRRYAAIPYNELPAADG
jgi:hypothetical protein